MAYFATEYTIHFDDTMAYGSHHFLTAFKLQCAARESFLFGDRVFDVAGVREALQDVHLFTSDAYARNLNPARVGDRIAILLTLEEWGRASARFCFRAIDERGRAICAGFQTIVCAKPATGQPTELPQPLWDAMESLRAIEEPSTEGSFRDRILAGGRRLEGLFTATVSDTAVAFLASRYPHPQVVFPATRPARLDEGDRDVSTTSPPRVEAWVFSGQGSLDATLLAARVLAYRDRLEPSTHDLEPCREWLRTAWGPDGEALLSGSAQAIAEALRRTPSLSQPAIFLQNMLGAALRRHQEIGTRPRVFIGHSFGEIAALGAAGCFDLVTGLAIVDARVRSVAAHGPSNGGLLAVATNSARVEAECAFLRLFDIVVAGRNSETQTIVSGPTPLLERLRDHLSAQAIGATSVASPSLFHHPLLRAASQAWYQQLRTLPLRGPDLVVYSPIGRRLVRQGDDIAATLSSQLVKPFDLLGAILDLRDAGITHLVDCGSSGTLTRLLEKIAPEGMTVEQDDTLSSSLLSQRRQDRDVPSVAESTTANRVPLTAAPQTGSRNVPLPLSESSPVERVETRKIAIVGMGCILPGGVTSPSDLFDAIQQQRNGLVDMREVDLNWSDDFYSSKLVPDKSTSHLSGRVRDENLVAPPGVSESWFSQLTRSQKLFCIALAPSLDALRGARRIRCYVGATADGFEDQDEVAALRYAGFDPTDFQVDQQMHSARTAFQEPHDAIRAVVEQLLGANVALTLIDAACASSLYSLALGLWALERNETDAVIAGGVFCPGPGNSCLFSQFKGTTSTGCRPFDARADGVVFSEGAAIVVLRPWDVAIRSKLPVAAVVRGVGLSSDGRSTSANVPQTRGQRLSLERCYAAYRLDPKAVMAIEGHGTSTPVGDSTELETLGQFFVTHQSGPLPLHSLKGLLGHAGWAAGTASVIAACEYLRRGTFPAQAHFREPSEALRKRSDVLFVPQQPVRLANRHGLIAVDGFGFGGANAHVVLQAADGAASDDPASSTTTPTADLDTDELVVVSWHELHPQCETARGRRFDRTQIVLGPDHVLLPDLADDMDISQRLAIALADGLFGALPGLKSEQRRHTSYILALSGKTERGVEATMRVMASRLARRLQAFTGAAETLERATSQARPSGPYTLQCMMPNVASGRAALQHHLNGPNFVVDAGTRSLENALESAMLLLNAPSESGNHVVLVAGVEVNPWRSDNFAHGAAYDEAAAICAVTSRSYASEHGLPILTTCDTLLSHIRSVPTTVPRSGRLALQFAAMRTLLETPLPGPLLSTASASSLATAPLSPHHVDSELPIPLYSPIWVETVPHAIPDAQHLRVSRQSHPIILSVADPDLVAELVRELPRYFPHYHLALTGARATALAQIHAGLPLTPIDLRDETQAVEDLARLQPLSVDKVIAVGRPSSQETWNILQDLATDNGLCEMTFLVARMFADRLKDGSIELWALMLDSYHRGSAHPCSGPLAGLLKAIQREHPQSRAATVTTSSLDLRSSLERLMAEWQLNDGEQEVSFDGARRLVRRLRPSPWNSNSNDSVRIDSQSVVMATAGARGVTAVMAETLLADERPTLIATGRSLPESGPADGDMVQAERDFYEHAIHEMPRANASVLKKAFDKRRGQWEAYSVLQRLRATGASVHYEMADVTNASQIDRLIQNVVQRFGRIDLLLHGAGIQISKKLESRSLEEFRQTFATKVQGLYHLVASCRKHLGTIPDAHLLTSAYSIFGNDGQHDYGAANETLDRFCDWMQRDTSTSAANPYWTSLAWLAWDGVGMTHGSEYRALAHQRGLSGITTEMGQTLFRHVIRRRTSSRIHVPLSDAEHLRYAVRTIPPTSLPVGGRLVERSWELTHFGVLDDHIVRGEPTLPGAWSIDLMVQTALELVEHASEVSDVTLCEVAFKRFVQPRRAGQGRVRLIAEMTGEWISVWLLGDLFHVTGEPLARDKCLAQAKLRFNSRSEGVKPIAAARSPVTSLAVPSTLTDPYCQMGSQDVSLSGPFDGLREIQIEATGRQACFRLPGDCPWPTLTPALLLDAMFRVGAMYATASNELYVPVQIGRLVLPLMTHEDPALSERWTILSSSPRVDGRRVHWERTEAVDSSGRIRLVLEEAQASKLPTK